MSNEKSEQTSVILNIRLPREVGASFVGAALAVSGAIMQGMTRNPLADPGLLGITAGANAALAITIVWMPSTNYVGVMIGCLLGAAVGAMMVFGLGAAKKADFLRFASYWPEPLYLPSYMPLQKGSAFISKFQKMCPCGPPVD